MNKSVAPILLGVLVAAPGYAADATGSAVDRLVACADLTDSLQRLVCFDREVAPLARARASARSAPTPASPPVATTPAPVAAAAPPPARAPAPAPAPAPPAPTASVTPAPSFGAEQLSGKARAPEKVEDQAMHANIASLRGSGTAFLVALDNGQTWRHEDQTLGAYLKEGEAVTIRKGTLGSYRLTRDAGESKNWIRVTRVR